MELAYWESDLKLGTRRQHDYNCTWCERRGLWNTPRKLCFRHHTRGVIPRTEVTERGFQVLGGQEQEVSADQVIHVIHQLQQAQPDKSAFDICRMLQVCPTGLLDHEDWQLLALEGAVREYGAAYLGAYGLDPVPAVVMDALQVIRETRNAVEARRWKKAQASHGH